MHPRMAPNGAMPRASRGVHTKEDRNTNLDKITKFQATKVFSPGNIVMGLKKLSKRWKMWIITDRSASHNIVNVQLKFGKHPFQEAENIRGRYNDVILEKQRLDQEVASLRR